MAKRLETDVCVIGAGAGGLSVAAGAAQMGASVVLVEKGQMGGDCLNTGCVPSKALLAAAQAAQAARRAGHFGVRLNEPDIDPAGVYGHVRRTIAHIAPHDSEERFAALGVTVIKGAGRFTGPTRLAVNDMEIQARRVVVATGSAPLIPPVPGLEQVDYLTNETLFDRDRLPEHLLILGGGPIGIEMAQAHRRLGCRVTVLEIGTILPRDDAELVAFIRDRLNGEGVDLMEGARVTNVARSEDGVRVGLETEIGATTVTGSHLLVAAGRVPVVQGLDLDKAGIAWSKAGIKVDARLRTSNRKVFAIGDVVGGHQFTHAAGHHASVVLRNILFRLPAKADTPAFPWVTYTDPELAHVGLNESAARAAHGDINVLRWSFHDNDRAQAEADTDGLIKVITGRRGRILGASMVGPKAGELILPWVLAVGQGMKIGAIAGMIAPYPTLGEVGKRAAGSYYIPKLFSERTRSIVKFLGRFG